MPGPRRCLAVTLCSAAAVAAAFVTGAPRAAPPVAGPTTVSRQCHDGGRRETACRVVESFFRDLGARRYGAACSHLGDRLRRENRGLGCPRFLAVGFPDPMPWGILGAERAGYGVWVLVTLGQSELGRVRMRHHRAYVAVEDGRPRILDTLIVS
jgi:hypothetical protein